MNKRAFLPLTCLLALHGCGESDGDTTTTNAETSSGSGTEDTTMTGASDSEAGTMDASSGDGDSSSTGDGDGDSSSTGDGDGDSSSTGDGDGDSSSTGDGDGDSSSTGDGDGDGDSSSTGDGDGDSGSTGDGDGDGDSGTTGDGDGDDDDNDGIPNDDDPFPNDPSSPGVGIPNVVYAHTSSTLFTMNVVTYEVEQVGAFTFDSDAGQVTDIALDRWGVLYAVTFNDVFVCDATTAACTHLGDLPQFFNGLTMVPPGAIDVGDDTLVGIANSGQWYRIDTANGQATISSIGSYGGSYTNSGDVFSIQGVGTYGAVDAGTTADQIVVADPSNGSVQSVLATTTGYAELYGLAGWNGAIFGFNSGGEIIDIDPVTGAVTELADTPHTWWGAGVFSVLPE